MIFTKGLYLKIKKGIKGKIHCKLFAVVKKMITAATQSISPTPSKQPYCYTIQENK